MGKGEGSEANDDGISLCMLLRVYTDTVQRQCINTRLRLREAWGLTTLSLKEDDSPICLFALCSSATLGPD